MKVQFRLDHGTTVESSPEHIILANDEKNGLVALSYIAGPETLVPVMNFPGVYFNPQQLQAHNASLTSRARAAYKAELDKIQEEATALTGH